MARKLIVEFVGDSSQLERSFSKASKSANKFGNDISKVGRGSIAAAISFRGLGRSIAFASAGFLGGFGLVSAIRAAFEEQGQFQKANAQTAAVLKSTGEVAGVTAENVDKLATSISNVTGLDDELVKAGENILLTFTNIRNVAGKNNDVFTQAIKLSTDLATAMHLDLQQAALQVGKALNDPARGYARLQRIGVAFTKQQVEQIKALEKSGNVLGAQKIILRELQREFGGSAKAAGDTLPGKLDKLRETLLNLGGAIAGLLTPSIEKTVDQLVKWTQNTENQQRVMRDAKEVIGAVSDAAKVLKGAFDGLNEITGSTKRSIELLIGAFAAFKIFKLASGIKAMADNMGLLATNSKKAAGALPGTVGGPAGPPAPGGEGTASKFARNIGKTGAVLAVAFAGAKALQKLVGQAPRLIDPNSLRLGVRSPAVPGRFQPQRPIEIQPPAGILGPITAAAVAARRRAKPPSVGAEKKAAEDIAKARRDALIDLLGFRVDQAAATKGFTDDLKALARLQKFLEKEIKQHKTNLDLQKQLLAVNVQIADITSQQAEARKAAAEKAAEVAKASRDARQFRLLGFGPTGEDLVPGVKSLKKTLGSVADAVSGSFLDTRKTRGLLGHIRQVLAGGLGSVSSEVRSKIQQILADLKAQLKQSTVDVTRFQKTATGQFALAGAHPAGRGVVINGGVHLHGIQNVQQLENELAKRNKQRAHARRATR